MLYMVALKHLYLLLLSMLLWNWLLPTVFIGAQSIGYWPALGILLLSKILFGGFRRGVLERQDVRQDVGPAELDAAEALRGDKTHGPKHCDQRQGRDPSPVGVVFFGGIHRPFSRVARGSGRRSKAPRRWR